MKWTNRHNLDIALTAAIIEANQAHKKADFSVTGIIKPWRMQILEEEHKGELSVDVLDCLTSFIGTCIHDKIEKSNKDDEVEVYFELKTSYGILSGTVDVIRGDIIIDWKSTKTWKVIYKDYDSFEKQLNIYRYLVYKLDGRIIKKLYAKLILLDWKEGELKYSNNYPKLPYHEVSLPVWKIEDTEDFIISRLEGLKQAKENYARTGRLPMCTDKERWMQGKPWAVVKKGNKKASRCFEDYQEAHKYMNEMNLTTKYTYLVHKRKVQYKRCEKWCSVAKFCKEVKTI